MTPTFLPANPQPGTPRGFGTRLNRFWQRTTDGLALNQLWNQFRIDTRTSYRLYSSGIDYTGKGVKDGKHWQAVSSQIFWAILEKLSPARRGIVLRCCLPVHRCLRHCSYLGLHFWSPGSWLCWRRSPSRSPTICCSENSATSRPLGLDSDRRS